MKPLVVTSMHGLGDCIYERPFVRGAVERGFHVWFDSPWPELYEDLPNFHPVYTATRLRTQTKNQARQPPTLWEKPPEDAIRLRFHYGRDDLVKSTILGALGRCLPLTPDQKLVFDLPAWTREPPPLTLEPGRRLALVRPTTERKEWLNKSRNPRPEYLALLANRLLEDGWQVVSVADLAPGAEWLVQPAPPATLRLHAGELGVRSLLRLIARADLVVGGVGWILPACIAAKTPLFCVLGGNAGSGNRPERLTDRRLDLSRLAFAVPDRLCGCMDHWHQCDKSITRLMPQFEAFLRKIGRITEAA